MRDFLRKIRVFGGRSISFVLLALGLLYVYPDIEGLPAAYGYSWGYLMPSRETLTYCLLAAALVRIVWIDVRPRILKAFADKHSLQIELSSVIPCIDLSVTETKKIYYRHYYQSNGPEPLR
jgi:hypothetical protein